MDFLYDQLVKNKQKAIAGWLAASLVALLADNGIALPDSAGQVFTALLLGLIGLVSVYLKRNK